MEWDTVIGLEVHAQLSTKSKLFSGAATEYGASANSQTCYIDAGLPGVLPVLNQEAVIMAIQLGLAINADINDASVFERKNYFYPDLPKGYQISQFQKPILSNGQLSIRLNDGCEKTIDIVRAHLEEDAGKSLHDTHPGYTGIDLNRAGTPLLEIVTAPCMYSIEEAISYLKTLHQLVQFLGICDGNMQEGSFRCDVNLSLKPKGSEVLGTRTELKNLNSFRYIEKALTYERLRQQELLESGQKISQETRLFDPQTNSTHPMRDKESEHDYRYFPDPDLLPITIEASLIASIKMTLPDLPQNIREALHHIPSLNEEDIHFVLSSPAAYRFYKQVKGLSIASDKVIINWLKGQYSAALNEAGLSFDNPPISAELFAQFLNTIHQHSLSSTHAKQLFSFIWSGETDIDMIIQREGLGAMGNDAALKELIGEVVSQYPEQVAQY